MDANFTIRPIDLQLEVDQDGITEFYLGANSAIRPFVWQIEVDPGVTEIYMDANFAI